MSHHLKRLGREHVILERGRVGQSWRSERWDSLMFQFPNSSIQLPGYTYESDDPDGYVSKDEIVRFIESYAAMIDAPVRCGLRAVALRQVLWFGPLLVGTVQGRLGAVKVIFSTRRCCLAPIP